MAALRLDPRTKLLLLGAANVVAFTQRSLAIEIIWVAVLLLLLAVSGGAKSAVKLAFAFCLCLALQYIVFPFGPKWVAGNFSLLLAYGRKIFPCLIVGTLALRQTPIRDLMLALRRWHVPQSMVIPLSVTFRYFPAIKDEFGYIRDAMKLRNIRGLAKLECVVVPLMISATTTAEELSAAAVTRGIENPNPKTSLITLRYRTADMICLCVGAAFMVAGFSVAQGELYRLAEHIGSVFQNPKSQFFNLDSDSELVFGLENAGIPPDIIRQRLDITVGELHIEHLLGKNIFTLSGGEKQSLAFGSVYAMNPEVFVLDEPTANLDAEAIETLRQQIIQVKSEGRIVLVAEHRLYFLAEIIDRAIFLKNGRIAGHFTRDEFLALPDTRRVEMGLRTLAPTRLSLPAALPAGQERGLSVEGLSCALDKQTVFRGITFAAGHGEVLGIIGNNGTGKSTLTRCLCGLKKQSAGEIKLDGKVLSHKMRTMLSFFVMQDVNHQLFSDSVWNECEMSAPDCESKRIESVLEAFDLLPLKDRHPMALSGGQKQRLAVATAVLSDRQVLIFDEPTSGLDYRHMLEVNTVRNNIRFGKPEATDQEMIAAAKQAMCHDFIMALPEGYDTVVGEGDSSLSGGEKQRISIARALLKNAPIVILDEATASVDPENEHLIQRAISALTQGKTIIVIAHRLATIENAGQILVVDDGRIVQSGTHGELIAQEGLYKRFVDIRGRAEVWHIA
jgi:energy-coupling factor transport system ATP-binding protein